MLGWLPSNKRSEYAVDTRGLSQMKGALSDGKYGG
jgi:hypothetical protein